MAEGLFHLGFLVASREDSFALFKYWESLRCNCAHCASLLTAPMPFVCSRLVQDVCVNICFSCKLLLKVIPRQKLRSSGACRKGLHRFRFCITRARVFLFCRCLGTSFRFSLRVLSGGMAQRRARSRQDVGRRWTPQYMHDDARQVEARFRILRSKP